MTSSFGLHRAILATAFFAPNFIHNIQWPIPLPLFCHAQLLPGDPTYQDYYCGWDWYEAHDNCEYHCPSGLDEDCPPLPNGRKRRCIAAAGCFERFIKVYWTGVFSLVFDSELLMGDTTPAPASAPGEDMMVDTEPPEMSRQEKKEFEQAFQSYLYEVLKEQLLISDVTLQEEEYNRPCVAAANSDVDDDDDSTSLDMTIRVVGEYIPIGDKFFTDSDLGQLILDAIYANPDEALASIKESSSFFEAMTGISVIDEEDVVETPSSSPSASPSRSNEQIFNIRIDPRPTGSYGLAFSVRTPKDGQTILLTGMSFVTTGDKIPVEYEIYSRLGTFEKYIAFDDKWELVASGETTAQGPKAYTPVLEDDTTVETVNGTLTYLGFKPLHVLGDRGMRSFYITTTNRLKATDKDGKETPIPILFSNPLGGDDAEGGRDYGMVASTPELEVWEGDGILAYPWPRNRDGPYYRRPRGFFGQFDYIQFPCHPFKNFTGWPCPYRPRTNIPTVKPTKRPTPSSSLFSSAGAGSGMEPPPTASPIEFSNMTIYNDGGTHTINDESSSFRHETVVVRENTALVIETNGHITAPENGYKSDTDWPAVQLNSGSILNATGGIITGPKATKTGTNGGAAIEIYNGQSGPETASYGHFYGEVTVVGGDALDGVGGDALYVHGFGTEAFIYDGTFKGGKGSNGDDGLSVYALNGAKVHIHSAESFEGDIEVGDSSIIAFYGCFLRNGTNVYGEFLNDEYLEVDVRTSDGGQIMLIPSSEQICETAPSMSPTNTPTISSQPTVPRPNGGGKNEVFYGLIMAVYAFTHFVLM